MGVSSTGGASATLADRPRPPARWSARSVTLAVVALALVVRLVYWRLAVPDYVPISDDGQYLELATNLWRGDGFSMVFPQLELHPTAFRPPGYPALLAALFTVVGGPSVAWAQALNLALGLVVVVLAVRLGRRIGGPAAGVATGVLVAVHPALVANDVVVLTEPLSLVLLLAALLALLDHRWLPAGLAAGALVLTRPSAQLLVVVLVVWVVSVGRRSGGAGRAAGLLLAGVAVVVAPWVVRNWVVVGAPVLVTSNGFNAAALYSPEAAAAGAFVDPVQHPGFDDLRLTQFDEVEWQHQLQAIALTEVAQDPTRVVRVTGRNLFAYTEAAPWLNEGAERLDGRNLTVRTLGLPLVWATALAGLAGLWRLRATAAGHLLAGVGAYFVVTSLVLIAAPRVRAPVDLVLCVAGGVAVAAAVRRTRTRWAARRVGTGGGLCETPGVRGLVQRVSRAAVTVEGQEVGAIGAGLCVLVGVTHDDDEAAADRLARKLWELRIVEDDDGLMNRSVADTGGEVLVISQFTLYGDTRKGRRPSWNQAARPEVAEPLVGRVVAALRDLGATVATGVFGAHMDVELVNDGPVTLLVET